MNFRLPHNPEFERDILGCMLLDNECVLEIMSILDPDDFHLGRYGTIYKGCINCFERHGTLDLQMLAEYLNSCGKIDEVGGYMTLANLEANVLSTGSAIEMAKIIAEKSTRRNLIRTAKKILDEAQNETHETSKVVEEAQQKIFGVVSDRSPVQFYDLKTEWPKLIQKARERKKNAIANKMDGVRLGWPGLDSRFKMDPTSLTILGARTSIGKTAFLMNVCLNQGMIGDKKVAVFSLEMEKDQLGNRLICSYCGIESERWSEGKFLRDSEIDDAEHFSRTLNEKGTILTNDTPGLSMAKLGAAARRLVLREKVDLIAVDYLQLMQTVHREGHSRTNEIGELSWGLKCLAKELHVPILALSQLSRSVEERGTKKTPGEPRLSDLRDSGNIEQDADNVIFLWRKSDPTEAERAAKVPLKIGVKVAKQRNGPVFTHTLGFKDTTGRFLEMDHRP